MRPFVALLAALAILCGYTARMACVPLLLAALDGQAIASGPQTAPDAGLQIFRVWLDREHEGYGADEGPAPFRNRTVDAAYPGQRFYYVFTHTRGVPPPYKKPLSLVAAVDDSGRVIPFRAGSLETYRRGLIRVSSAREAKLAAAAVLIMGFCDPAERRWAFKPDRFKAKRYTGGWMCTFKHGQHFSSWVRFDRDGYLAETGGSAPPVP